MNLINHRLRELLDKWPGKRFFGIYRFLPAFFILGAALEFSMINWTVGQTNFCVSWGHYIRFSVAAFVSMMLGSQAVHMYYKPLKDLDEYIAMEKSKSQNS